MKQSFSLCGVVRSKFLGCRRYRSRARSLNAGYAWDRFRWFAERVKGARPINQLSKSLSVSYKTSSQDNYWVQHWICTIVSYHVSMFREPNLQFRQRMSLLIYQACHCRHCLIQSCMNFERKAYRILEFIANKNRSSFADSKLIPQSVGMKHGPVTKSRNLRNRFPWRRRHGLMP